MALTLTIVTPERALPAVACDHVTFTAVDGQLGIRPGHASVVGLLDGGFIHPKKGGRTMECVAIKGGVGQVAGDRVLIITEAAVTAAQVDRAKVEAKLASLDASRASDIERKYLAAQLALPKSELTADEQLAAAKQAIDAQP